MKRVIGRILATAVLLSALPLCMSGCLMTRKVTAATKVAAAFAKTAALDSFEGSFVVNLQLADAGADSAAPVTFLVRAEGVHSEHPKYIGKMKTVLPFFSIPLENEYYLADGWVYYKTVNRKYKVRAENDTDAASGTDLVRSLNGSITADILKGIEPTEEEGLLHVTLALTEEQFKESFTPLAKKLGEKYSESELTKELFDGISFRDITMAISVNDDGYIQDEALKMQMTIPFPSAEDLTVNIDLQMEYTAPGTEVTVEEPADLNEYKENGNGWNFDLGELFGNEFGGHKENGEKMQ